MNRCCLVYMTVRDNDEALLMGRALVNEKLCACVNILGPVRSLYLWKDAVHDDPEVALIAKTTEATLPALLERAKALHSYENPCIVALPISAGSPPFLDWITETVTSP
ncbi:divalent-cation tolerance protein CutA [Phaeovibrio sulfidiphilus]|uniref:divalent-cation tolerance protein CutA n=1 Tax=Phaeovibrio sulfidiphilus TaxID=1220600 RepID=UPI00308450A8